jgi:hypothetical protein
MALFKTPQKSGNGEPVPASPQLVRSRFQEILDDMNSAFKHMDHAAHLASTLVHDFEKGLRYIDRIRIDLTQSIEEAGGAAQQTNIEEEIKAYIPNQYRPPEADPQS